MISDQNGSPVQPGYHWRQPLVLDAPGAAFPPGSTYRAEVRTSRGGALLATLTTENGGIVRVSDTRIDLVMTETMTAAIATRVVVLDIVRADLDPCLGPFVALEVPVLRPVTQPEVESIA